MEQTITIKTCFYRNCNNTIVGRRKHSKYCSNKCRENEKTYIKREKRNFIKEKKLVYELIDKASSANSDVLELYKMIYR